MVQAQSKGDGGKVVRWNRGAPNGPALRAKRDPASRDSQPEKASLRNERMQASGGEGLRADSNMIQNICSGVKRKRVQAVAQLTVFSKKGCSGGWTARAG